MTFLSAFEDFVSRTLAAVPGTLGKLLYTGSLRQDGSYQHWGLERTHGTLAAATALAEAHTQTWLEVLRTPLPELAEEMENKDVTGEWSAVLAGPAAERLTPELRGGGTARHFNSILLALSLLSRSRKVPSQQAA